VYIYWLWQIVVRRYTRSDLLSLARALFLSLCLSLPLSLSLLAHCLFYASLCTSLSGPLVCLVQLSLLTLLSRPVPLSLPRVRTHTHTHTHTHTCAIRFAPAFPLDSFFDLLLLPPPLLLSLLHSPLLPASPRSSPSGTASADAVKISSGVPSKCNNQGSVCVYVCVCVCGVCGL